ncbi:biotin/lipoyl-containing protein, partial [Kocuria sp.]|uniref:biotin/lipoyl-containing protein n=1 Tax=Kocuria sp. TaxID=1871328 RepID=UPI0026DB5744
TKALEGRDVKLADEKLSEEYRAGLHEPGATRRATLNRLLFPGPTKDFQSSRTRYGNLSVLHTRDFLYGLQQDQEHVISLGKGVRLLVTLQAISEPDEKGMRTVMVTLNGQLRLLEIRDESVTSQVQETEKADTSQPGHVAAPFAGAVTVSVSEGDSVSAGESVATIEAMKMEASITAPVAGTVSRVALNDTTHVAGGDLVLVIDPS